VWGSDLQDYRLYFLARTGRIERGRELACEDDAEAIKQAATYAVGVAMELWQAGRLVKSFPPVDHTHQVARQTATPGHLRWPKAGRSAKNRQN